LRSTLGVADEEPACAHRKGPQRGPPLRATEHDATEEGETEPERAPPCRGCLLDTKDRPTLVGGAGALSLRRRDGLEPRAGLRRGSCKRP
jgi:hypothetical protein